MHPKPGVSVVMHPGAVGSDTSSLAPRRRPQRLHTRNDRVEGTSRATLLKLHARLCGRRSSLCQTSNHARTQDEAMASASHGRVGCLGQDLRVQVADV